MSNNLWLRRVDISWLEDIRSLEWLLSNVLSLNWLLDILVGGGDWLLNNRLGDLLLLLFYNRLVNNLSLDSLIFNSFNHFFLRNVFDVFLLENLRNILNLVFNGIVVGDLLFLWHLDLSLDFFVFDNLSLVWDSFGFGDSLILNDGFLVWNILNLGDFLIFFNNFFLWDLLDDGLGLIFNNSFFIGNIFNSGLALDWSLLSHSRGSQN